MVNAIGNLLIAAIFIGIYRLLRREKKKNEEFIQWITNNKALIYEGRAYYDNAKIILDTELTQFQFCLSFGIFSVKTTSRYYIDCYHHTTLIGITYSIISCILGWWGLPLGPIYTIQTLINNIKGGKKIVIGSMFKQ